MTARPTSLRRRFLISFAAILAGLGGLSLAATLGGLFLFYRSNVDMRLRQARSRLEQHLQRTENALLFRTRILAEVARIGSEGLDPTGLRQLQVYTLRWLKRDGLRVIGMGGPAYWEGRKTGAWVVGRAFAGVPTVGLVVPDSGPALLLAATPREGPTGVGEVIAAALPLDTNTLRTLAGHANAEIFLYGPSGTFLGSSLDVAAPMRCAPGDDVGAVRVEGRLYACRRFPVLVGHRAQGSVVLLLPTGELRSLAVRLGTGQVAALTFCFVVFAALYRRVVARTTSDLEVLSSWAGRFDPDRPVPPPTLDRDDEVGVLARSFADMVDRLEGALTEVAATNRELARANASLEIRVQEKTRELEEHRRLLDTVLRGMPQAVLLLDPDGRVGYANQSARDRFGPLEGTPCNDILGDRCPCQHPRGGVAEVQRDGRIYLVSATPLEGGRGMVLVAQDVTEHRALERQLQQAQRLESVGRLAAGVAHDFNNILGSMVPCVDMLRRRVDDPRLRAYLDTIANGADRASELVRQLLTFSRSGEFQPVPLDLNEAVLGAIRLLEPGLRDVDLVWEPAEGLALVRADPTQVQQAVLNLGLNAVDAMEGKGTLRIETFGLRAAAMVGIAVEDSGPGVPQELADRIFDPFFTTKEPGKGTGLGLAIVYGVAERHGGRVRLVPRSGKGARFEILLPAMPEPAGGTPEPPREHPGMELLVVDDDPMLLATLIRYLRDMGYRVRAARTGEAALEILEQDPDRFAAALLDVRMPGTDGIELARRIRERFPGLPFTFITGYAEDRADEMAALGCTAPIPKPFTAAHLAERLRELLGT